MKTNEINIRDPFLLLHEGKYYLYGTRSATCWGEADGFDCYVSADRENWDGPFEIFRRPDGFWADRAYWAPECVFHDNAFFLITTLGAADRKKGIYVLRSQSPRGPFAPWGWRSPKADLSSAPGGSLKRRSTRQTAGTGCSLRRGTAPCGSHSTPPMKSMPNARSSSRSRRAEN